MLFALFLTHKIMVKLSFIFIYIYEDKTEFYI